MDEARRLLGSVRVVRVATVDGEGRPHLVVATFAVEGDRIHMAVDHKPKRSRELKRVRNIRGNPRVSVLADHYEEDWGRLWWVRADGEARVVEEPGELGRSVDLLVERYPQYRGRRPEGPAIVVEVRRWVGWIYGGEDGRPAAG
ncbi:TIGR03668 family PPOX class F420-dependent oxidoreductase [Thermomonospora amylolytica]|uniref:TIGR03668 family PPOX class F420-dependent oxidoreductase n=1 Tax=Thermomonospora amylolytica TaxID=1411117 RepID=UPI002D79D558|nr:TIGR03668 family PPOX class F420-dependent oxidoreductase [Thermomonospora amylolytica]